MRKQTGATTMQSTTTVQISLDHLLSSVDAARTATAEKRWLNAIDSAYEWLMEQDSVTLDADGSLLVESATEPGKIYAANGSCQCVAYIGGNPCWHRSAARLVRRMMEAMEKQEKARQIKALGVRLAERRRAYDEIDALFI
jgi:hypothetical protein